MPIRLVALSTLTREIVVVIPMAGFPWQRRQIGLYIVFCSLCLALAVFSKLPTSFSGADLVM
jgi:hypothetical protein